MLAVPARTTRSCWRCGAVVPVAEAVRMNVRTGMSGGGRGARVYFGRRTLCSDCARRERIKNRIVNLVAVVIVLAIVLAVVIK